MGGRGDGGRGEKREERWRRVPEMIRLAETAVGICASGCFSTWSVAIEVCILGAHQQMRGCKVAVHNARTMWAF